MTFVVCIKVNDGVVLAADSATTMSNANYYNVYNNANKLFSLIYHNNKPLPIAALTFGLGNIGQFSIATIAKDFRRCSDEPGNPYYIDSVNYTVEEVVDKFKKFVFEDRYEPYYSTVDAEDRPDIGFYIAGYPSDGADPKVFTFTIQSGALSGPNDLSDLHIAWGGQPEFASRLLNGFGGALKGYLFEKIDELKITITSEQKEQISDDIDEKNSLFLVNQAMPMQDAIDLARFLVETTIQMVRFDSGGKSVGGPIDIATITEYEGFKWIQCKHFYPKELNS